MSTVIKWGVIGALIVALIALILSTPFIPQYMEGITFVNNFSAYATEFVAVLGGTFLYARQLLNNFLPADLVSITIALTICRKPLFMIVELASTVIKGIYK